MPRYVYTCEECNVETEAVHSIDSDLTVCCHKCGSDHTHRVPQAVGVIYATSGFFHIDSGKRFESQLSERGKRIWQKKKAEAGVA